MAIIEILFYSPGLVAMIIMVGYVTVAIINNKE